MATVKNWDFFNVNVQSGLVEGRYMNAAFTLIAAGPPRLAAVGGGGNVDLTSENIAYPVGIIQSFNMGQNAQVMKLFEIGSERSYFIRGRSMGQLGLGRIMYHGPSLLRVLYAYLEDPAGKFKALYESTNQRANLNTSGNNLSKKSYEALPGYKNLWLDLASDVFSQPIGLMMILRDSNADTVGAFYFEYCHIVNHGFATDAGGTIISENASVMYERVVPVDVDSVDLIPDAEALVDSGLVGTAIGSATNPA